MQVTMEKQNTTTEFITISKTIKTAIQEDNFAKIDEYAHIFTDSLMDSLLSDSYNSLFIANVNISKGMQFYIQEKIIQYRYYSTEIVQTSDKQQDFIKEKELVIYMDLLIKNIVDNAHNWKIDISFQQLLKNIIYVGNAIQHFVKVFPWIQFLFYVQRFIAFHTIQDEINIFYISVLTKTKLIKYLKCCKTALELHQKRVARKRREMLIGQDDLENLKKDYFTMRDLHSLKCMAMYLQKHKLKFHNELSFWARFRTLQVLGECLKNTPASPNISKQLEQNLSIGFDLKQIVACRDLMSHLQGIPQEIDWDLDEKICQNLYLIESFLYKVSLYKRIQILSEHYKIIDHLPDDDETIKEHLSTYLIDVQLVEGEVATDNRQMLKKLLRETLQDILRQSDLNLEIRELLQRDENELLDLFVKKLTLLSEDFKNVYKYTDNLFEIVKNYIKTTNILTLDKSILKIKNELDHVSFDEFKENFPLKCALELLIVIIMEQLKSENRLNANRQWLNDQCPTLIGNELRNQLAHKSTITNLLRIDEDVTLYLNAKVLIQGLDQPETKTRCIGRLSTYAPEDLQTRNEELMNFIDNDRQTAFWKNLKDGRIDLLENALQSGDVDLNATRETDGRSALHIAVKTAKSPIVVIDWILKHCNLIKDINSQDRRGATALHIAASIRNQEIVQILLEHNFDLDVYDNDGLYAVHYAIRSNHIFSMKILLQHDQFPKYINFKRTLHKEETYLHVACQFGRKEIVKFLLANGADVNGINKDKETPIHYASKYGFPEVTQELITNGADVNVPNKFRKTPLRFAIDERLLSSVRILLKNGAASIVNTNDYNGQNYLHRAAQIGHIEIIKELLRVGANVNAIDGWKQQTPLFYAVIEGHLNAAKILIENGADVDMKDTKQQTALNLARSQGHINIDKFLTQILNEYSLIANSNHVQIRFWHSVKQEKGNLRNVAQIWLENKNIIQMKVRCVDDGKNVLQYAIENWNYNIVRYILLIEPSLINNCDRFGQNIIQFAAYQCQPNTIILKDLLDWYPNTDINYKDNNYRTALHLAVMKRREDIVEILLNHPKIDLDAVDKDHYTVFHISILYNCSLKLFKLLLKFYIKNKNYSDLFKSFQTKSGSTCLHLATCHRRTEIVDCLLQHGANVNALDLRHSTPINYASSNGHLHVVKLLITNGANIQIKDKFGNTPLRCAFKYGRTSVVDYLSQTFHDFSLRSKPNCLTNEQRIFWKSIKEGEIDKVEQIWQRGKIDIKARCSDGGLNALQYAVQRGDCKMIKCLLLLDLDANLLSCVDFEGKTILHFAAQIGNVTVVNLLLKYSLYFQDNLKDVYDNEGLKALHVAVKFEHLPIIKLLLTHVNHVDDIRTKHGETCLHIACKYEQFNIVKYLLENNAHMNSRTDRQKTPLHFAADTGNKFIIKLFLKKDGAHLQLNLSDIFYILNSALDRNNFDIVKLMTESMCWAVFQQISGYFLISASCKGLKEIVLFLLEKGVNACVANAQNGFTSLHYAVYNGYTEVILLLIDYGADVNACNLAKETPLHIAASRRPEIVITKLCLDHGANINAKDKFNQTPANCARRFGHIEIAEFLEERSHEHD